MDIFYARVRAAKEGGFLVEFPGVPGAVTQGETRAEALEMAAECLRTHLRGLIATGQELPLSRQLRVGANLHTIVLPALDAVKLQLYRTFRASGLKKAQLASRMGIPRTHVDRLFNLNHASRLNQIESAFRVLGKTISVVAKDAA